MVKVLVQAGFQQPPKSFFCDIICWAGYITFVHAFPSAPQLANLLEHLEFSAIGPGQPI